MTIRSMSVSLVAAVLMSEVRRWRGLYSAIAYLPVVVPPVVFSPLFPWKLMVQPPHWFPISSALLPAT